MKAFTTYHFNGEIPSLPENPKDLAVTDPVELAWRSIGLRPHNTLSTWEVANGDMYSHSYDNEVSLTVAIVERILPSSTIKRHLVRKRVEFEQQHEKTATKSQIAVWKEEFVKEMLPNCPLRETKIDVSIDYANKLLLVGTSSQKNADAVTEWLRTHLFEGNLDITIHQPATMQMWLKMQLETGDFVSNGCKLEDTQSGEKTTFRNDADCQSASRFFSEHGRCVVTELSCYIPEICKFTVTNKCVVKSISYVAMRDDVEGIDDNVSGAIADHILQVQARRAIIGLLNANIDGEDDDDDL